MVEKRIIMFLLTALGVSSILFAETVEWAIIPQFDQLDFYCDGVYKYHKGNRCGLVDIDGVLIADNELIDSITPVTSDGRSLLLQMSGENEGKLIGIFSMRSHRVAWVEAPRFMVMMDYAYFSDDLMPVKDENQLWGYVDPSGSLRINFRFSSVRPFSCRLAPVQDVKTGRWYYINTQGAYPFPIRVNNGKISVATVYDSEGFAVVGWRNNKDEEEFAKIDRSGKVIDKGFQESFPTISPQYLQEGTRNRDNPILPIQDVNSKWGYNTIKIPCQFQEARSFLDNDRAICRIDNRYGLLRLVDGAFEVIGHDECINVASNGSISLFNVRLKIPIRFTSRNLEFRLGGEQCQPTIIGSDMDIYRFSIEPNVPQEKGDVLMPIKVMMDGLVLFDEKINVSIKKEAPINPVGSKSGGNTGKKKKDKMPGNNKKDKGNSREDNNNHQIHELHSITKASKSKKR